MKAIYKPTGKALEFAEYACNFYVGCQGMCSYCFNKKGMLKGTLGGDKAKLKTCFKDVADAKRVFVQEMRTKVKELQNHGLFFSFTSDFFPETSELLIYAIEMCLFANIPVKILTKQTDWITSAFLDRIKNLEKEIAFGFTLTGHDEMEEGCATNIERIFKMKLLHKMGFITWASIEPIIDFQTSLKVISDTAYCCDHYKIGLQSGKKYNKEQCSCFIDNVDQITGHGAIPIYWKDSIFKLIESDRNNFGVKSDYDIFKNR